MHGDGGCEAHCSHAGAAVPPGVAHFPTQDVRFAAEVIWQSLQDSVLFVRMRSSSGLAFRLGAPLCVVQRQHEL